MASNRWSREQLVQALSLYCQIPFGKMHARNPAVGTLADAIGRTPSAIALKLVNFASLDPDLRGRGIGGMGNTSIADRAIWAEFYGKWDVLAARSILPEREPIMENVTAESPKQTPPSGPTEVRRERNERRGQSFFRWAVLAAYDRKCCVTGITCEPLLRASHIIPWSSDPSLRLDPRNGLCLNALHDAAFDRGLITFTERCELQLSKRLKHELSASVYGEMFAKREGAPIQFPDRFAPTNDLLEFHRLQVFQH